MYPLVRTPTGVGATVFRLLQLVKMDEPATNIMIAAPKAAFPATSHRNVFDFIKWQFS
jgi:hypothetical protein